ncbi:MAG: KGK domain-containing protein [Microcystaceae cyanobacterium]
MKIEPNHYLKSITQDAVIKFQNSLELYQIKSIMDIFKSIFDDDFCWGLTSGQWVIFSKIINSHLLGNNLKIPEEAFTEGIDCEILDANFKSWKKGKFQAKLVVEFIPDEPETNQYESPLDEIRREIAASKIS